jgi:hypothetical protein
MTAFAALLARSGGPIAPDDVAPVAGALERVYASRVSVLCRAGCTLLQAPLHAAPAAGIRQTHSVPAVTGEDDARIAARSDGSEVAAAGQVLLEDPGTLASILGAPRGARDLDLAAAAYVQWGPAFTQRLRGEFSFVVWDGRARALLAARDGLGIRTLYVAQAPRLLIVTNVLAAAIAHPSVPDALDEDALLEFLAWSHRLARRACGSGWTYAAPRVRRTGRAPEPPLGVSAGRPRPPSQSRRDRGRVPGAARPCRG